VFKIDRIKNSLKTSIFKNCVLAFFLGFLLKIIPFSLYSVCISVSGGEGGGITLTKLKAAYPEGIASYSVSKYFSALIAAPIIENLILPLIVWLTSKSRTPMMFGFFGLASLMYYGHGQGMGGLAGAILFIALLVQYYLAIRFYSKKAAYFFTVITHFSFNLSTFSLTMFLNFLIL